MNKILKLMLMMLALSLGVSSCDKSDSDEPTNATQPRPSDTPRDEEDGYSLEEMRETLLGVWKLAEGSKWPDNIDIPYVYNNDFCFVFNRHGLGYCTTIENLTMRHFEHPKSNGYYNSYFKRLLLHWSLDEAEAAKIVLELSDSQHYLLHVVFKIEFSNTDKLKLTINENTVELDRYVDESITDYDLSVENNLFTGCWFWYPFSYSEGIAMKDLRNEDCYVLCPDGTGFLVKNGDFNNNGNKFNWKIIWATRPAYFSEIISYEDHKPLETSYYLDINFYNGSSDSFIVTVAYSDQIRCQKLGGSYDLHNQLTNNGLFIPPATASGQVIEKNNNGGDNPDPDQSNDTEISEKLVGKWVSDKNPSFSYVFLSDGTGYTEDIWDSNEGGLERHWLHWSVSEGVLTLDIDALETSTKTVEFDDTKLKLVSGSSSVNYSYSSTYLKYSYGEPPYDGYYIHDLYTDVYYPIYTAEEQKNYAASGEMYNHLYLRFRGKNNGNKTWALVNYCTIRGDGLPSGWSEGKYYMSTSDGPYKYTSAFKINNSSVQSTTSDYLEIKKSGNYFSYRYYGKNVEINFTGNLSH